MSGLRRRRPYADPDSEDIPYADPGSEAVPLKARFGQRGEFDDPKRVEDIQQYNPERSKYTDTRTTSTGKEVMADMAINALQNFYRNVLPIFEYDEGLELETDLRPDPNTPIYVDGNEGYIRQEIAPTDPKPILNANIRSGVNSHIVFALTSSIHAILCILSNDGILYTVGFGYSSAPQQTKLLNALRQFQSIGQRVAHAIEEITGALYTADYLLPTNTQACKIAWVGYLTKSMCDRLQSYLDETTAIIYSLERKASDKYFVTNNCTLTVNQKYSEASGVINRNSTNCIRWLQKILGVQLNCGVIVDDPASCIGIEETEWIDLADGIERNDLEGVKTIIEDIQHRLKPSCSLKGWKMIKGVCRYVGLTSGGKRTRKIGNKRKNNRKNKSRSHKKSRTYKRK
jgi:hypothetical protein